MSRSLFTSQSLRLTLLCVIAFFSAVCTRGGESIAVANPSFQADVFSAFPGYRGGANPPNITGWTATGGAGINGTDIGAGVPFADNGAIPDNTRAAFIQGVGSLAQTLSGFEIGQPYWVQIFLNARNCCGDVPVVSVTLGGAPVVTDQQLSPVGGANPYLLITAPWTATATSGALVISARSASGGDASLVLDGIAVIKRAAAEIVLANPSFEASGNLPAPGTITNIAGWAITRAGGESAINSAGGAYFDNALAPDGASVLALRNAAAAEQAIGGLVAGQMYRLQLFYNAREAGDNPRLKVAIGGQGALDETVAPVGNGQPFRALSFDFTADGSAATLRLENMGVGADSAVLIDNVSLLPVGAIVTPPLALHSSGDPGGAGGIVTFNEIHYNPADAAKPEWIELVNEMGVRIELSGWRIGGGIEFTFPAGTVIEPGGFLVVSAVASDPAGALGPFTGELDGAGEELRLRTRQGWIMDRVAYEADGDWPSAADGNGPTLAKRSPTFASAPAGNWAASTQPNGTPAAANFPAPPPPPAPSAHVAGPIVINEILYHQHAIYEAPGIPYAENPAEWIELHNRTGAAVDMAGWRLSDAISYTFPAGASLAPGGFLVVDQTQFSGSLANSGDSIKLRDLSGALMDKVRYRDGGRWSAYADGGGVSLELSDPNSDNTRPEAWAGSDESGKSAWQTITYRATGAEPPGSNNPATWREFLLGFLDAGEALIDDVSVIEDPDGVPVQVVQNGTFENDTIGASPQKWRILGTHRGTVMMDPGGTGKVLKLVATAELEHTYNCASTTFAGNRQINPAKTYQISFRAKWLAGSPQLNSRLYLNRAARTTILAQPAITGTPGAPNSRRVGNAGPTYDELVHTPLVPARNQPVTVLVRAADFDGIAALTLFYSVNGGAAQQAPMTLGDQGRFSGTIPGQSSLNATVQFWVRGTDALGGESLFPAAGPASRALVRFGDGGVSAQPLQNRLRLIMMPADAALLHNPIHGVSNARLGATAIYNDREVFYGVGVRLRSAPYGRQGNRAGWNIEFDPEQPFRGVERSIVVDGALNMPKGDGTGWIETTIGVSINELLFHKIAERAGSIAAEHDDIIYFGAPRVGDNRRAQLRLKRYNDEFLDEFVPNGSNGALFKQELIYYPTTTVDGNPESLKSPYSAVNQVDITYHGPSKDAYRFNYLVRNGRARDDFSRITAMAQAFAQPNANLYTAADAVLDQDAWMRTLALNALVGLADAYNQGLAHNIQFYVRPSDQRVMLMPWDMDHAFYYATNSNIYGQGTHRVATLIQDARNRRRYAGHLLDFCNTSFSNAYLDPWIDHYNAVAGQSYAANFKSYVSARRAFVLAQINSAFPQVAFAVTTNSGADFSVPTSSTVLTGTAWIDVHEIRNGTTGAPYATTWINGTQWQITVPLLVGANAVKLDAVNQQGAVVGSDTITITNTGTAEPAAASNFVISELMYHPGAPTEPGFTDADDFEFIELLNVGARVIELRDVRFSAGIDFTFTGGTLAPGMRVLLVRNQAAFEARYGAGMPIAGVFAGALDNGGERLTLLDRGGGVITDFVYDDEPPWPADADGRGYSLTLIRPETLPDPNRPESWRLSRGLGGSPNTSDALLLSSFASPLDYAFAQLPSAENVDGFLEISARERLGAEGVRIMPETSTDLVTWTPADEAILAPQSATAGKDGTLAMRWRFIPPIGVNARAFVRFRVTPVL